MAGTEKDRKTIYDALGRLQASPGFHVSYIESVTRGVFSRNRSTLKAVVAVVNPYHERVMQYLVCNVPHRELRRRCSHSGCKSTVFVTSFSELDGTIECDAHGGITPGERLRLLKPLSREAKASLQEAASNSWAHREADVIDHYRLMEMASELT